MAEFSSYCEYALSKPTDDVHRRYHDLEYGFPILDDNGLFARLILEINQAGLSWTTILNKKENFFRSYHEFDLKTVANFGTNDIERLLNDEGIIRNRLKVAAAIHNAGVILNLQKSHGSFKLWLDSQGNLTKDEWIKLFKKHFKFTGGEITGEFLMSTGYLPGAHVPECPVYQKVAASSPAWMSNR